MSCVCMHGGDSYLQGVCVLQSVAVCCSCVAMCHAYECMEATANLEVSCVLQCVAVVLQCVVVRCIVLQRGVLHV